MVSVVVFCDCINPLIRDCGKGFGEFFDRGVCVFETVCATLCGSHVRAFPLDTHTPQGVVVGEIS
jgi:hypothetical protein